MEIKVEADQDHHNNPNDQETPLLKDMSSPDTDTDQKTLIQKAISQTFQSTAHLANLLPTGTVLAFQLLSPIATNQGHCDPLSRSVTAVLVAMCSLTSFLLCFTDSVRDKNGNVVYGFATMNGLWIIDGLLSTNVDPQDVAKYRLRLIDFAHAFMTILVFGAVALFDQNVVNCLYPTPSDETKEMLTSLPVAVGVFCSMLFVVFPTRRHGIGFPVSTT